jgi:hypothetical protein
MRFLGDSSQHVDGLRALAHCSLTFGVWGRITPSPINKSTLKTQELSTFRQW